MSTTNAYGRRRAARAQRAAKRLRKAELRAAQDADRLLAKRRRITATVLAASAGLSAFAVGFSAWAAARYDGEYLLWWWGVGGKRSHVVGAVDVATGHASVWALQVTCVPVLLAALSLAALSVPRIRTRSWISVPVWVGAYFAPGLAVGVVASFGGTLLGQTESRDFLPAMASVAPLGLPLFALFAAAPFFVRRDGRLRSSTRART